MITVEKKTGDTLPLGELGRASLVPSSTSAPLSSRPANMQGQCSVQTHLSDFAFQDSCYSGCHTVTITTTINIITITTTIIITTIWGQSVPGRVLESGVWLGEPLGEG